MSHQPGEFSSLNFRAAMNEEKKRKAATQPEARPEPRATTEERCVCGHTRNQHPMNARRGICTECYCNVFEPAAQPAAEPTGARETAGEREKFEQCRTMTRC